MTPTRQTIFVAHHPKGRGNCMSACLASVLDLPLAETIDTTIDEVREDWEGSIGRFLADRGLKLASYGAERAIERGLLAGRYSIGSGPSPRGDFWHAVVCKSGHMVFDPHPSDDGVVSLERHQVIVRLSEAEHALHALGRLFPVRTKEAA